MNRRSFFNTMMGTAPVAASTLAMSAPVPPPAEGAIEFLNPMCPACCCLFDVTAIIRLRDAESYGERAIRGLQPVESECRCGWRGRMTFFRRQTQ